MPDFSTFFRDMGTGPAIIGIVFVGLLIFSIFKGGGKGNGSKGGSTKSGSSGSTTPPPSNPS